MFLLRQRPWLPDPLHPAIKRFAQKKDMLSQQVLTKIKNLMESIDEIMNAIVFIRM